MAVHNADISALFNRMADLLEIEAANPFRIRAYRRAVATIDDLPESIAGMVADGRPLSDLPGIGEDLVKLAISTDPHSTVGLGAM